MTKPLRARSWVFTLNNYTDEDEKYLQETLDCDYLVYGREVGESGTPHLQGFVYFKNARAGKTVGKLRKWHIEPAKADVLKNQEYCKKGDDWYEKGVRPLTSTEKGDGERDRFKRAIDCAIKGDFTSIDSDILIRHYSTLKRLQGELVQVEDLTSMPYVVYFYGDPGLGKSRLARELVKDGGYRYYIKDPQTKWFTGYAHEPAVVVDEIEMTNEDSRGMYKRLCDRYVCSVETKGGNMSIRPRIIVFTSNFCPAQVFGNAFPAMERRMISYLFTPSNQNALAQQIKEDFRTHPAIVGDPQRTSLDASQDVQSGSGS